MGSVEHSQYEYEYEYEMPTQKIEQEMTDFVNGRRTLHNEFYPPKDRLKLYRRKVLMEEKEEHEKEEDRIKRQRQKEEDDLTSAIRKEMLREWKYNFKEEELTEEQMEEINQ